MPEKKKKKVQDLKKRAEIRDHVKRWRAAGIDLDELMREVEDSGKDIDEIKEDVEDIKEEVHESGKDVDEIKEDVDEIKEDVEQLHKKHDNFLKKISSIILPAEFNIADVAQQIVGAMILSAPFAVTEEVWKLANAIDFTHIVVIIAITLLFDVLLLYFTKYREYKIRKIMGVMSLRLFSLVTISYIAAALILMVLGVIGTQVTSIEWTIKLIVFVGLFANIGAGTADMLK